MRSFGKVCVDAVDYCDVKVFSVALYRAAARGRRFLFRTAASLVKALGGVSDRPLLRREEMVTRPGGGIVVVGSHTGKTTEQLERLLTLDGVVAVEFASDLVLEGDAAFGAEVSRCCAEAARIIRHYGADRVFFGTDYPMWSPVVELAHFQRLPLTQEERALNLHKNAEAIFGIA